METNLKFNDIAIFPYCEASHSIPFKRLFKYIAVNNLGNFYVGSQDGHKMANFKEEFPE